MKVKLEKEFRRHYTLEELDMAKAVINAEKEDESTAEEWAEYAVREALKKDNGEYADYLSRVITAKAETAKNYRAWNEYGETGNLDVWIEAMAKTYNGFIEVGAYLSDIWKSGAERYKHHMYIRYYKEASLS